MLAKRQPVRALFLLKSVLSLKTLAFVRPVELCESIQTLEAFSLTKHKAVRAFFLAQGVFELELLVRGAKADLELSEGGPSRGFHVPANILVRDVDGGRRCVDELSGASGLRVEVDWTTRVAEKGYGGKLGVRAVEVVSDSDAPLRCQFHIF